MKNNTAQSSTTQIDSSLLPKSSKDRTMNPLAYSFMWIGDGMNLGNMTLGAS